MSATIRAAGLLALLGLGAAAAHAQPEPTAVAGTTDVQPTPALREVVYSALSQAQECAAQDDFECARRRIERVAARDDLNGYERAVAAQFSAYVNFEQGRPGAALADYQTLLAQPGVPVQMRSHTLYRLSQLHVAEEQHEQALETLARWFELTENPEAEAYVLRARIQYALERWTDGAAAIDTALGLAEAAGRQAPEGWHQLDAVFGYELGGCERAYDKFAALMRLYPKRDYYVQAAGCAGGMGDTQRQLELMDVAAASGLLGARDSFTHAFMLLDAARYEDARRAIAQGGRLLDVPADSPVRAHFDDAAALIASERYGDAAQALSQGLSELNAAKDESRDSL